MTSGLTIQLSHGIFSPPSPKPPLSFIFSALSSSMVENFRLTCLSQAFQSSSDFNTLERELDCLYAIDRTVSSV